MSEPQVRALLVAIVRLADPEAVVHDYDRFDGDDDRFVELLRPDRASSGIHAWIIDGTPIEPQEIGYDEEHERYTKLWRYTYELQLYLARDDTSASKKFAVERALRVMTALDRSAVLHGTEPCRPTRAGEEQVVLQHSPGAVARLARPGVREFRGTIKAVCHRLLITQQVTEILS